ncbi:Crp/Fnr family transcriptional regulator [Chitinophaga sp. Ak27]|uniref:Crp/Fnr family transcriptional regulator n=1 Tax=Chitinophaga sp. Ak27 TaxID=2726116 RepID=UPI00145E53CA|nr:Crp/Fnr family transcriptional regulator [Chitinophaga sp. Ak27]NLU94863.1 Crp/Fnr family transcriptional regulator [Chitinophaga sp. Ak27]
MEKFVATLSQISELSPQLREDIASKITFTSFKKKEQILREGEICNYLYFVEHGLLRAYYLKDGEEISSLFMEEGDFVISVLSFYKRQASHEFIVALEDCQLCGFHYDDLNYLYRKHVEFNLIGRILTEAYFCLAEERLIGMRKSNAEERFRFLLDKKTDLIARIPGKDLATYLGVTPETLSRMRSAIR